ncbi:bile acid:sodium symporter [Ravibacter arvi]|uniref:Bile acid:sodium symporter n=1 Tax=Ravibacter arvi TaxID=2051041 RepID=A0ABP8M0X4_9BACT
MNFFKTLSKYGLDGFLSALLLVIFLAYLYPYPGSLDSRYRLNEVANSGVSVIFFFYGLKLGFRKLRDGLENWRLHLFIQSVTFFIFPLAGLALRPFFYGEEGEMFWLGVFFLCALPSTVSSSVVMVSIAGGNVPAAIFNASISSLLGVFITPAWLGLVFSGGGASVSFSEVIGRLCIQVLLPVVAGMVLHRWLGDRANRKSRQIKLFDQSVILLIVYCSFCQSFTENLFAAMSYTDLLALIAGMLALFFLVYFLTNWMTRRLDFGREDRIAALFCGSKKSLIQGAVMSNIMFSGTPMAGIILLPIMVYHALQLLVAGVLSRKWATASGHKESEVINP